MKSKFNKLITALFCTFLAIIIVASCKKDYQSKDQPNKQELNKLAQWYENNLKVSENNPFSKLKPDWTKVYVKQQGPHNVYEISLANQEKLVVSTNEEKRMLEEVAQNTGMRLLIFEERASDKILYASYMNLQANAGQTLDHLHYRDVGNFSGTILYYHFSGNLSNGWNYLNGKITEKITAITEQQFNQAQKQSQSDKKTDAMVCTSGFVDKYQWQCVGVPGYLNCGFNYVGKEYITVCNWQEPEQTIDHIAPEENGGAYLPPIYIDCANVANGKATWSNECNTCIGGTTGIEACPPVTDIKKDSLQKYYPCMVKEILDKLFQNGSYSKLIQPFQAIVLPNGTPITLPGLPKLIFDFSTQTYGGSSSSYQLGETDRITGSGMSSVIRFNSAAMNNASKLFLQATAIHEAAHSYANFYYKSAYYGVPVDTTKYSAWAMNIARLDALASGQIQSGNFNDHSMFLENYVEKFVTILKELNGTSYTDQEYQMAALFGLNNAGQPPSDPLGITVYNIYKSKLDKSFNNLLTKYGITTSQINSFNADNLINVPAAKKLPTNCP